MTVRLALAIACLLAACDAGVPPKRAPARAAPKDAEVVVVPRPVADCPKKPLVPSRPDDVLVMLTRDTCYGPCPAYQVVVYRDGRVEYVGTQYVAQCEATDHLDGQRLRTLTRMFEDNKFLALKDAYTHEDWTDAPSAEVMYQPVPGTLKRVAHYHGDSGAPPVLNDIEDGIDRIIGTARWTAVIRD
jgi:hypothetical protein